MHLDDLLTVNVDHDELLTRLQLAISSFQEVNLEQLRRVLKASKELEAAVGAAKQEDIDG